MVSLPRPFFIPEMCSLTCLSLTTCSPPCSLTLFHSSSNKWCKTPIAGIYHPNSHLSPWFASQPVSSVFSQEDVNVSKWNSVKKYELTTTTNLCIYRAFKLYLCGHRVVVHCVLLVNVGGRTITEGKFSTLLWQFLLMELWAALHAE